MPQETKNTDSSRTELSQMIREGEHQRQDFKFCINDARKIARSLVAFANTNGGRLLIGVKDNGNIAGVRSDEEYYMIESAAKLYCRPEVDFNSRLHHADNKVVLEVVVAESTTKPHLARDKNDRWMAYYRLNDQNKLASKVLLDVWHKQKSPNGIFISYSASEKFLLGYLNQNGRISHSVFARKARISYAEAGKILSDFVVLRILKPILDEHPILFGLDEGLNEQDWQRFDSSP